MQGLGRKIKQENQIKIFLGFTLNGRQKRRSLRQTLIKTSTEDRHRFDADPDPDSTFHFYAGPDPDSPSFTHDGKSDIFSPFIHSCTSLNCFICLISVTRVRIFNILYSVLNFFLEKSLVWLPAYI
ncbi:MAG: hypothetical protein ACK56I_35965, partial [bacterium]